MKFIRGYNYLKTILWYQIDLYFNKRLQEIKSKEKLKVEGHRQHLYTDTEVYSEYVYMRKKTIEMNIWKNFV